MNKRRNPMLGILLCCTILFTPALAFYGPGPNGWACSEVRAALDSGFPSWETAELEFSGYLTPINRLQFCLLIGAILGKDKNLDPYEQYLQAEQAGYQPNFTDLKNRYGSYAVYLANHLGIVDGIGKGMFDPDSTLTREQAAKLLAATVRTLRPSLWQEGKDYLAGKRIADQESISPWAANDVGFIMEQGFMSGVGEDTFAPQASYTVEQAVVTCYRLCQQLQIPDTIPVEHAATWLDESRMDREIRCHGDLSVYYGGEADGIAEITVGEVTVDGIGVLEESFQRYEPEMGYLAEFHAYSSSLKSGAYYTAHVELTFYWEDGREPQQQTDTFVFLYQGNL